MSMLALVPTPTSSPLMSRPVTPRVGMPSRSAILTALAAAAVRHGNVKAVLVLAQTARPKSLMSCAGQVRWLALAGLEAVYPEAARAALMTCFGLKASTDRRQRAVADRVAWSDDDVQAVARAVAENEAAQLTAKWIWPHACAVAAEQTGAEAAVVATVTGSRATPPRVVARARKLAVYLTVTEGDVNLTAMAAATGLDKSTVRFHVNDLGDARDDDGALDAELDALAATLRARLDGELSQW